MSKNSSNFLDIYYYLKISSIYLSKICYVSQKCSNIWHGIDVNIKDLLRVYNILAYVL